MSAWQPIETAPTDGTIILLTDGTLLAAGQRTFRVEPDWKYRGYNAHGQIDDTFTERVPNPDAGKRDEWWQPFGASAFDGEIATYDYDGSLSFQPTHWMPLPEFPR